MTRSGILSLVAGAATAIGASACCAGPLLLLGLGVSGAWIGRLTVLEPVRPLLTAVSLAFLVVAFVKLHIAPPACAEDAGCPGRSTVTRQRIVFWSVTLPLLALLALPWYAPLFY